MNTPDYTNYSLKELYECMASLDREAFPEREAIIICHIEKIKNSPEYLEERNKQKQKDESFLIGYSKCSASIGWSILAIGSIQLILLLMFLAGITSFNIFSVLFINSTISVLATIFLSSLLVLGGCGILRNKFALAHLASASLVIISLKVQIGDIYWGLSKVISFELVFQVGPVGISLDIIWLLFAAATGVLVQSIQFVNENKMLCIKENE